MLQEKKDAVLFIPGLNDRSNLINESIGFWQQNGFSPHIHVMPWKDQDPFDQKFNNLLDHIHTLSEEYRVSVVGVSAGGVAALSSKVTLPTIVNKAVNICGRVRKGQETGFRGFQRRTETSPSFRQAVVLFESSEHSIPNQVREEIMNVRPKFGLDELVPGDTVFIEGANNLEVNRIEHVLAITYAVGPKFAPVLMNFIKS
jgi:hypothetical protein